MGEGRRGVFSQGGGGLPNWWLDSEEQWAGFWLGGEGHLPGLTPPPPNSPPPRLTGGPDIPQRPGCSALGMLSQRARLAEFKARCIAAWRAAGRRGHQCKYPSQRGPRLGPGVGAGRAAMPSWAKQRSQAGVDRNRTTTHTGQSLSWTVSRQNTPKPHWGSSGGGPTVWRGPYTSSLGLGVRQHSYASPGPFCPAPAPGGTSGTPPGFLSAYTLGPATACLPGTWSEYTPASRTALAVTSQDVTVPIPVPSS